MSNYIHPLQQIGGQAVPQQAAKHDATKPFKEILKEVATTDVRVSKHAKQRLGERNIHINKAEWETIGEKMEEAKNKGVTDALVVVKDATLVVSTKNNTVVTALHQEEAADKIFTNINGTIFI